MGNIPAKSSSSQGMRVEAASLMAAASYRGLHYLLEKILLVPPMVVGEVNLKNSSDTTHILLKQF